jgi:pimeloyl-ACP methyl ester carboxylesterase
VAGRFGAFALMVCLTVASGFSTGCATSPDLPRWFDSLQRIPLKSLLVNGNRIAYLDHGTGPPVILVHGLGGSLWQWEYQQDGLARAHRIITLDLLGSGFSDKPDLDYTPTVLLEFFRSFMDALGIRQASLIGNSMGGGIVIGMALTYPERVHRLVLIDGLPDRVRDRTTSPLIRRAIDSPVPVWLIKLGNFLTGRGTTRSILEEIVYDRSLLTPAVIDRSTRNRARGDIIGPVMSLTRNLPLWEETFAMRLGEIEQPTLILWGAEDRIFPPQVGREVHARIRGSSFVIIPEAGHIPQWEQPQRVNQLIREFLHP